MSTPEWNVGDEVAYYGGYGRDVRIGTVTRLTATQVIADFYGREKRFRRRDGWSIGDGTYHSSQLRIASDNDRTQLLSQECRQLSHNIERAIGNWNINDAGSVRKLHAALSDVWTLLKEIVTKCEN